MREGYELPENVKLTKCQVTLFKHITEICGESPDGSCFKSIKNMAKDCKMALQTAHRAKHKLIDYKLITVKEFPNGKRENKRHKIELVLPKVEPRNKLWEEGREYRERVRWEDFDMYTAAYVNSLPKLDQIDLYIELGLKVIPVHFWNDSECSCIILTVNTKPSIPRLAIRIVTRSSRLPANFGARGAQIWNTTSAFFSQKT